MSIHTIRITIDAFFMLSFYIVGDIISVETKQQGNFQVPVYKSMHKTVYLNIYRQSLYKHYYLNLGWIYYYF